MTRSLDPASPARELPELKPPGRMPARECEGLAMYLWTRDPEGAPRAIMRTLGIAYDEARAMCAEIEAAERRAQQAREFLRRGGRVVITSRDAAVLRERFEFYPSGVMHVASHDSGRGADRTGTKACKGLLCGGAQRPVTAFGVVHGSKIKSRCRRCLNHAGRTAERQMRSGYMREWRRTKPRVSANLEGS